jgi:hypothetical protein
MKCYVWNCDREAVQLIQLTTSPHKKLPVCREHEQQFPQEYIRFPLNCVHTQSEEAKKP